MFATPQLIRFVVLVGLALGVSLGAPSRNQPVQFGRTLREHFFMDPDYIQLNHGAYGTYPKTVSDALHEYQLRSERNPDLWIRRDSRTELVKVRKLLAEVVSADADDIVIVPNTTGGMNAILRSLVFEFGDRILHLSTIFNSMASLMQYRMDYSDGGLSTVVLNVTYPISNDELLQRLEAFLEETHDPERPIRLALIDHISATPGVVVPIDRMIPMLKQYNITVLVDGAHAIGQVPINITALAPDYYVTNAHKWLYAARGCALLYVDKKHQGLIHPAHISQRYRQPANFQSEFEFTGTMDFSAYMTVPAALAFRESLGGEQAIMDYIHALAVAGGQQMAQMLGTEVLQSEDQIGALVDVRLPVDNPNDPKLNGDWWVDEQLYRQDNRTFAPVYKHNGAWWARISAQVYNDLSDFEACAQHFLNICNGLNNSTLNSIE